MPGTDGLDGVGGEVGNEGQKTGHVGEMAMAVEGGLIGPFGVDAVEERIAGGFVKMNVEAAGLGAGGLEEGQEFVLELLGFTGSRLEADEDVKRHGKIMLDEKRKGFKAEIRENREK